MLAGAAAEPASRRLDEMRAGETGVEGDAAPRSCGATVACCGEDDGGCTACCNGGAVMRGAATTGVARGEAVVLLPRRRARCPIACVAWGGTDYGDYFSPRIDEQKEEDDLGGYRTATGSQIGWLLGDRPKFPPIGRRRASPKRKVRPTPLSSERKPSVDYGPILYVSRGRQIDGGRLQRDTMGRPSSWFSRAVILFASATFLFHFFFFFFFLLGFLFPVFHCFIF